nr:gliding motility-associated C-terminal domain-containing protein [uncultured Draconibacterium sp.]
MKTIKIASLFITMALIAIHVKQTVAINAYFPDVEDQTEISALTDFFNSTNGSYWTDNTNWLSPDLSTWFGIFIENGDVVEIILNDNNLEGELPNSIGNLTSLKKLFLARNNLAGAIPQELANIETLLHYKLNNNKFTSLPDFSGHPDLGKIKLQLDNNNLDFGDLEPLFDDNGKSIVSFLSYMDQAEIGETQELTFYDGMPVSISVETPGDYNTYQWQKMQLKNVDKGNNKAQSAKIEWVDIEGATDSVYTVENYIKEDILGKYRCAVSNTKVPGLTLYTKEIGIEISDYVEIRFYINTTELNNGLDYQATQYQVIAPELNDTIPFGGREGFVIVHPDLTANILLNILKNNTEIGVGYQFQVNSDGTIHDLKLKSGLEEKEIHPFFYEVNNSELSLYPVLPVRKVWSNLNLTLEDGVYFSPDDDGFYDFLEVSGTEEITQYLLEIKDINNNLVFKTDSVELKWDGKNTTDSVLVPTGVYTYSILADDKELSGQMIIKY